MTTQKNRTKHSHRDKVVELHVPQQRRDSGRLHVVKQSVRHAPWWVWTITVAALIGMAFYAGSSWYEGRSLVYAEQLADTEDELQVAYGQLEDIEASQLEVEQARTELQDQVKILEEQIAAAPDQATVDMLESQRQAALERVEELDEVIIGWQGRTAILEGQVGRLEQSVETQREMIHTQANRANALQSAETARIAALPGQIMANLQANPPADEADYSFTILQETIEEAFGQHFFGWLDEIKWVTAKGNVQFESEGPYSASNSGDVTEVRLPLPTKSVHGLYDFTPDSFEYDPGFLAQTDVQDVSDLIVWVEREYLVPRACTDVGVMRDVVANAEAQIQSVAGEREVEFVWISKSGQTFSSHQLTYSVLLANAC